jgi:hypothetical protein
VIIWLYSSAVERRSHEAEVGRSALSRAIFVFPNTYKVDLLYFFMVIEEIVNTSAVDGLSNLSVLADLISTDLFQSLGGFVLFLKAIGVVFVIYILYLFTNAILNIKKSRRIKKIEKKVNEIDKKLTRILSLLPEKKIRKK